MNETISEQEFQFIRKWLRHYVGQDLATDKQYLIQVSLLDIQKSFGFHSISEILRRLEQVAPVVDSFTLQTIEKSAGTDALRLVQNIIDALMVNETYFFRRPTTFEDLRSQILPRLIEKRLSTQRLKICCLACSTGQEPYSLAMTIDRYFPNLTTHWDISIIASDISSKTLQKAEAGLYSDWELSRGLDTELKERYFHQEGTHWRIDDRIRRQIQFRQANLIGSLDSLPYWPFDLILLRNVLIYFDTTVKRQILAKMRRLIADDGLLILGESETLLGLEEQFSISNDIPAICVPKS